MSVPQLKLTLTMAAPRPVEERTLVTPGMLFMASSMGRVMVAIISLAGMMPLLIVTTMRGKFVSGKTEDGVLRAQKNPATHSTTAMNMMEIAFCVVNFPRPEGEWEFISRRRNWWPKFRRARFGF